MRKAAPLSSKAERAEGVSPAQGFRLLHNQLGALAGDARKAGNKEREQAFVDALKIIAQQMAKRKNAV